ncbi:MAG: glycosyltransferase family 9 protein [Proteobacteria bacterium]|nr:glycosyltransferase family 9 protein [Pseudomonadota bacterium]
MKILIIKLGALGDVIISTAVVKKILEHHQQDEISLLTTPAYKNLFSNFENLNVIAFERKGFINTIKVISWIRRNKFERIYDLQSNDRSTIYCALSGVAYRAGNHPRFPYHVHPEKKYIGECHSFERLNQIITSAGIQAATPLPYLPIPETVTKEVSTWLDKHGLLKKSFAILHAGSSPLHLKKRWPHFLELAKKINQTLEIVWIGGNDDIELNELLSKETGINATGAFDILGLAEFGKRAKFAVTNDSAPMHILSCSQIPVFGIFGPTYPRRTHALGQLQNIITASDDIASNDESFKPEDISRIPVDKVLNKLKNQNLI